MAEEGQVASEVIRRWGLAELCPLTETGAAWLWRATSARHGACVVKRYKRGDPGNEAAGLVYLRGIGPDLAVEVLEQTRDTLLMRYLPGPLLGDLSRSGRDDEATQKLADVARGVLQVNGAVGPQLTPLQDNCAALLSLKIAPECPSPLAADMRHAAQIMQHLLSTQSTLRPLHGDLHHDNVIETSDGPRVIDAKGVLGDPGYELANAMRNPKGAEPLLEDPHLLMRRARVWSAAAEVPLDRFLQWSAAKCALSIAWRAKGALHNDKEAPLLRRVLDLLDQ